VLERFAPLELREPGADRAGRPADRDRVLDLSEPPEGGVKRRTDKPAEKLVAAEPHDRVVGPQLRAQRLHHRAQQRVAGGFGLVGLGVATWSLTGPALTEAARTGPGAMVLENVVLRPPGDPLAQSLADWAEQDPAAAWQWALTQLAADGDAWQGVLARIARHDPARALGCATQLAHDRADLAQIAYATAVTALEQAVGNLAEARNFTIK